MPKIIAILSYAMPVIFLVAGALMFAFSIKSLLSDAEALECFCPSCPDSNLDEAGYTSLGLIKADIQGAVKKPGIYQLKLGQRLSDLLLAAEGFVDNADQEYVAKNLNLATEIKDQDKFYIPFFEEREAQTEESGTESGDSNGLISINQAGADDLESLSGIGEVKAQAIIDARPFSSLDELVNKGILSENLFTQLKAQICL